MQMDSSNLDLYRIHSSLDPLESVHQRHLDRFTRFYTTHPYAQHTDTQTTLRATSVAIGRIYALQYCNINSHTIDSQNITPDNLWQR